MNKISSVFSLKTRHCFYSSRSSRWFERVPNERAYYNPSSQLILLPYLNTLVSRDWLHFRACYFLRPLRARNICNAIPRHTTIPEEIATLVLTYLPALIARCLPDRSAAGCGHILIV